MLNNIKNCTGCGACQNICPRNAVSIEFNQKGFYAPLIAENLCVQCGMCRKVCPALEFESLNFNNPICYVAYADDEERKNSTSGGIFPVLAKYVLKKNGYVCGVTWNKDWEAEHILINKEEDLKKLRFSKYVQSKTNYSFKIIKKLLNENKLVLFSGTPCQNAGLIKFLGKNYDNLITVDVLCHGAPSPKVWQDYLEANFDKEKIAAINFRKKDAGWLKYCDDWFNNICNDSIDMNDGIRKPIGIFYEAFIKHKLSNDACLKCKYRSIPRPADFTLGDFWHLYYSKLNDHRGLSAVVLNSNKAKDIFKTITSELKFYKRINLKGHYEKLEMTKESKASKSRERFFVKYSEGKPLNKIINEAIGKHYDIGLITQFNFMNYGSALVAYAANKIIEDLGYTVLMIDKDLNGFDHYNPENKSLEFAKDNYNLSKFYALEDDLRELNDLCDTFIVGSDTMWWDTEYGIDFCWLDFVRSDKRKISLCTSFAHVLPTMDSNQRAKRKFLYKRFDAISVREASGVKILKEMFEVEGIHLYDPTLIANRQIFDDLADKSRRTEKNFVFAYILDLTPEKEKAVKYVADKLNLKLKLISNMRYKGNSPLIDENNVTVEDFVYFCKNADFIMSDSFHGTCFSTIYEKPFISIVNAWRGLERYKIFIDNNLDSQLCWDIEDFYKINLYSKPDYSKFRKTVEKERKKAKSWLKSAMEKPLIELSKEDFLYDYIYNTNLDNKIKNSSNCALRKDLFTKVFSIKDECSNNRKRRVITILGIKIKYKII